MNELWCPICYALVECIASRRDDGNEEGRGRAILSCGHVLGLNQGQKRGCDDG